MKVKYEDRQKQKVIAITTDTLVVGVDIAKNYQWARFVDFRGIEHDRALKFKNSRGGFETILARIREICKKENFAKAVVGMERHSPIKSLSISFINLLLWIGFDIYLYIRRICKCKAGRREPFCNDSLFQLLQGMVRATSLENLPFTCRNPIFFKSIIFLVRANCNQIFPVLCMMNTDTQ